MPGFVVVLDRVRELVRPFPFFVQVHGQRVRFVTLVLLVSQSDVSQSDTPHRPPHTPFEMPFTTNSVL